MLKLGLMDFHIKGRSSKDLSVLLETRLRHSLANIQQLEILIPAVKLIGLGTPGSE